MKLGRFIQAALTLTAAFVLVGSANAGLITYDTNGTDTQLLCGTASGCSQNTPTSITIGGITLTYDPTIVDSLHSVSPPTITPLGAIDTSGSGDDVSFTGATLTIGIDDTSLGVDADMPIGTFSGTLSTDASTLVITFSSDYIDTVTWGSLPGIALTAGLTTDTFQVQGPTEGIEPANQDTTTLQGVVSQNDLGAAPEPATMAMVGGLLVGLGALARKRRRA